MLDYPTTLRKSLVQAKELAVEEFGLADLTLIGGDNVSDYPYWKKSMLWVKDKLNEIDPDGRKLVFVVGHLSAICHYNDGILQETMRNGDVDLFYHIFKGHRNTFYLYGHVHGERSCYRDFTSSAVLHIKDKQPIDFNLAETDSKGREYEYTFVHMGGLRPFSKEYMGDDGLTGFGGNSEKAYHPGTATPTLAQYLVFEVYSDRVVFHIRNTGTYENYTQDDKLKEYTVYLV